MFTLDRLKVNLKISNCILLFKDTQLMNVSKDYHGIFFKMDVYLVYSCTETINKSISQHVHLWIGAESSEVCYNYFLFAKMNFCKFFIF
jgi:hypothetical protein